jgi:hypothetical protein
MHTLDIVRFEPLWQGMGIYDLRTLAAFIDRPYPLFTKIVEQVQLTLPGLPHVTHTCYDGHGVAMATIDKTEGVAAIITGLKLFAKYTVDSYSCNLVSTASVVATHNILSLYSGFRNLHFRTSYNQVLKYLVDRLVRLSEGDSHSAYTSTLSQVPSNDILSVLDARREEIIVFEDTGAMTPQPGRTPQRTTGVPTEVSYDTPIRGNRQLGHAASTTGDHTNNHGIPTMITCPPLPEKVLVTLSPPMVNAMYKNLCAIYSSRHSGTIPELLRPNADEVYAILQNFGRTYYDCAGWQNDPSLSPLLFDPTFLTTLLHRVTRVRSPNYVRELEASSGNMARDSRPPTSTGLATRSTVIPTVKHSPEGPPRDGNTQ